MRGIVNIVVDNWLFLKLTTVATYTTQIENDLGTPNIQLFLSQMAACTHCFTRLLLNVYSGDISWFCSFDHNDKIETQCG